MGAEFGQESEWAESRELDWWLLDHPEHRGLHSLVRDLNRTYRETPALWALDNSPAGFQWIDADDTSRNVYSFVRRDEAGEQLVCVANFAALPHDVYRLGLPTAGVWEEVLNTDADTYSGSGVGNLGVVTAVDGEHAGWPAYADLRIPPLGTLWLRRRPQASEPAVDAAVQESLEQDPEEEPAV
jgi:1,4-alpha-glucan branching enzyme